MTIDRYKILMVDDEELNFRTPDLVESPFEFADSISAEITDG